MAEVVNGTVFEVALAYHTSACNNPRAQNVHPAGADPQGGKLQLATKAATIIVQAADGSPGESPACAGNVPDGIPTDRIQRFSMDMPMGTLQTVADPMVYFELCKERGGLDCP